MKLNLKKNITLLFIIINFYANSQIKIIKDFESYNVGSITYDSAKNTITFEPYCNTINTEKVWFYFGITGYRTDTILTLKGKYTNNYYAPNNPVYSYNNIDFFNIRANSINMINKYSLFPQKDTLYTATGFPYGYQKLINYLNSKKNDKHLTIDNSIISDSGRIVPILTITDKKLNKKNKKLIWIIGRQHAFESIANYVVEGMTEYLLSNECKKSKMLKKFVFKIIPMVDVDNVADGQSGRMSLPKDYNRDWATEKRNIIHQTKIKIAESAKKFKYSYFFDIHSVFPGGKTNNIFSYYDIYCRQPQTENMKKYWLKFNKIAGYTPKPINDAHDMPGGTSADWYNAMIYNNLNFSTTIECDWNFNSQGKVWQIEDYLLLGKNMIKAIE